MKRYWVHLVVFISLLACNDPKDVQPIELIGGNLIEDYQLLVLNEGNYGSGVGTISKVNWSDSSKLQVEQNAFYNQNKEYLGNVLQSISEVDGELWVVINNSQKIVRCTEELKKISEINGLNSPRYIVDNQNYVFISDLYEKSIYVWSKTEEKIIRKINTASWNEELLLLNDKLFVPQTDSKEVLVLDAISLKWLDTIAVAQEPFALKLTSKNEVLVLCNGGLEEQEKPYLYYLDGLTNEKLDSLDLSDLSSIPSQLLIFENRIFVLAKHLYEIEGKSKTKVIDGTNYSFYGLGAKNGFVFLTDAKDFVRNGVLHKYELEYLSNHDSAEVGVIPGFVY